MLGNMPDGKVPLELNHVCDACGKSFNMPAVTPAEEIICPYCRKPLRMDDPRQQAVEIGNLLGRQLQDKEK